jgi:hypothetical protein
MVSIKYFSEDAALSCRKSIPADCAMSMNLTEGGACANAPRGLRGAHAAAVAMAFSKSRLETFEKRATQ